MSVQALVLRDKLVSLVWNGRDLTHEIYRIRSRFDHLAPALAILCERQLSAMPGKADPALIHGCVIASRFGGGADTTEHDMEKLRKRVSEDKALRACAFWAELAFIDRIAPTQDVGHRLYHAEDGSLTGRLIEGDHPWLLEGLADESVPQRRSLALYALLNLWGQRGRVTAELDTIRAALKGNTTLERILAERAAPLVPNVEIEKMERNRERRKREAADREEQRVQGWLNWRKSLFADPSAAFTPDNVQLTMSNLYKWLNGFNRNRNRR